MDSKVFRTVLARLMAAKMFFSGCKTSGGQESFLLPRLQRQKEEVYCNERHESGSGLGSVDVGIASRVGSC